MMATTMASNPPSYVIQWNCRGLTHKVGELQERIRLGSLRASAFLLQEQNSLPQISGFTSYATPSIPDRRACLSGDKPGKAAIYVHTSLIQTAIPMVTWCTAWQEVVAIKVQLSQCAIVLVPCYVGPHSGQASRLRLGWITWLSYSHRR